MEVEVNMNRCEESQVTPPRFFQHIDLFRTFETAKTIDQTKLINMINHLHFTDRPLFILLKHPVYQNSLLVKAHPEPCLGSHLTCRWDESFFQYKLEAHHPLCLITFYDSFMIIAPYNLLHCDNNSFTIQLPERTHALNQRQFRRYPCSNVSAELMQSDFVIRGELIDFSAQAFRIKACSEALIHTKWFNPGVPVSIRLFSNEIMIYSESCRCIRWHNDIEISNEIVFASEKQHVSRFPAKKIRNPRRQINPPLTAIFEHPFIKKKIRRDIFDISATGFSIRDEKDDEIFFPGMKIPCLAIQLAGISIAKCVVQIIYRRIEDNDIHHYGLAFLDMDIHSYSRINHILSMYSDPNISISTEVDTDNLWNFFFQTGFIYPEKYGYCQAHRKIFIETYQKLYQENPEIARHITYEKNGQIYGHISMIRAYERAWLIQHHSSSHSKNKLVGLHVLEQMMLFLNGMYQFSSAHMGYVIAYFRPENKFPNRVFGGFARNINNPQACSVDHFSYLTLPATSEAKELPDNWILRMSNPRDFWELSQFYRHNSGGLLLNILNLGEPDPGSESLENIFERLGFFRTCRYHSLIYKGQLKAFFIVDQSDMAINMSNLLNCIKALITDPVGLPSELLSLAVTKLGIMYNLDMVTLLIYPAFGIDSADIIYKKQYHLWILNLHYSNQFMDYVQKSFRMKFK
jgi:hypothetical protein